jgi:hypothetical protein
LVTTSWTAQCCGAVAVAGTRAALEMVVWSRLTAARLAQVRTGLLGSAAVTVPAVDRTSAQLPSIVKPMKMRLLLIVVLP